MANHNTRKEDIKQMCLELGADLVGVAAASLFKDAPAGYHPTDVLPGCQSVVVLCCEFPKDAIPRGAAAYTQTRNDMSEKMSRMAEAAARQIKAMGFEAAPVKAITATSDNGRFRGPISLKHAAELAGLGKIGKNTLLVNDLYGNMIWLSAVCASVPLESDPPAAYALCGTECDACARHCPAMALKGPLMNQRACYAHAFKTIEGKLEIQCWACRQICPHHLGKKNGPGRNPEARANACA